MAPQITPKLLVLFRDCQDFGTLSSDLLNLFKLWCNYQTCRSMFVDSFLPFIVGIINQYYLTTANTENQVGQKLSLTNLSRLNEVAETNQKQPFLNFTSTQVIDSSILANSLDLIQTLLKKTDKESA